MSNPTIMQNIRIAVSYYCNLHCRHCYVPETQRLDYRDLEKDQLSVDQINQFIDYLIDEFGLMKVTLTGGEPLLAEVWQRTLPVLQHALHNNLAVQINTSGSGNVPMKDLAEAAGSKLDHILLHASLDGIDPAKVDAFRGSAGAMDRAIAMIRDAVGLGINVQARYTATQENADDAVACYALLEKMGVNSFMLKPMLPSGNALLNAQMVLSQARARALQVALLAHSVGSKTRLDLPSPVYVPHAEWPQGANAAHVLCVCGVQAGYIAYNGDIMPCTYIAGSSVTRQYTLGNIKDPNFNFRKVWTDPKSFAEYRRASEETCTTHNILYRSMGRPEMYHLPCPDF